MDIKTRVYHNGKWITITGDMDFFVASFGSGQAVFGEPAKLTKITKTNLVFTTESGTQVRTHIDDLNTVGKAHKHGYSVCIGNRVGQPNVIKHKVWYFEG